MYGPNELWPAHDLPRWQETLKIARAHGWTLRKFDGHWFGMLACPTGTHTKPVDCTARNSEIKAKEARKAVEKTCQCDRGTPASATAGKIDEATSRLGSAERLLSHAAAVLDDLQARADVEDQLDEVSHAEGLIGAAALNLAELQDAALAAALALDEAPAPEGDPYVLMHQAGSEIASAQELAGQLRRPQQRQPLVDRAAAAMSHLAELKGRLQRLKERQGTADG